MRHKDRWFHLTISLFALALAAVSGIAIEYQKSPARVQSWLAQLGLPSLSSFENWKSHTHLQKLIGTVGNSSHVSQQPVQSSGATGAGTQTPSTELTSFRVMAFNNNVSKTTVNHTQALLTKYNIPTAIQSFLGFSITRPATIELVQNKTDYQQALQAVGVNAGELQHLSMDTGGFTTGRTVIIPLYQNQSTPQLVNTLTHELTHVYLNENGGELPSWINEGLAVTMGMKLQSQAENSIAYSGYAKRMAENVLQAVATNTLQPLTGNEKQVIQGNASYDLELQDWLAVKMLLSRQGTAPIHKFLGLLHKGSHVDPAFSSAFGMSQSTVNSDLTKLLTTASAAPDEGVKLQFFVPQAFQGSLRILPHGNQVWVGFPLSQGTMNFTLLPNGKLQGVAGKVSKTHDSQPPDKETVYFNLDSNKPLTYQGHSVRDAGFALDYHNGLYGFVNSWITEGSGKTVYLNTPALFGVQLRGVEESNQSNPLLSLLK